MNFAIDTLNEKIQTKNMKSHELITSIKDKILALLDDDPHDVNFMRLHDEILVLLSKAGNDPLLSSYSTELQKVANALEQYCAVPGRLNVLLRDLKNPTLTTQERMAILADVEAEEKRREAAHFALRKEVEILSQLASQFI